MSSPLLLMLVTRDGAREWHVVRHERAARGWVAKAIVIVREPTEAEEETLKPYRDAGVPVFYLEQLVAGALYGG